VRAKVRGTGSASGCRCNPGARCAIEVSAAGDGDASPADAVPVVTAARSATLTNGGRKWLLTMDPQEGTFERIVRLASARFEFKLVVPNRHSDGRILPGRDGNVVGN